MDLNKRKLEIEKALQKADTDMKQIRDILVQKEQFFLITKGRLVEIEEQLKTG